MDNMSHIFPLVFDRVKIGHSHCFILQRKLTYSINVVYEIRRQNIFIYLQAKYSP